MLALGRDDRERSFEFRGDILDRPIEPILGGGDLVDTDDEEIKALAGFVGDGLAELGAPRTGDDIDAAGICIAIGGNDFGGLLHHSFMALLLVADLLLLLRPLAD